MNFSSTNQISNGAWVIGESEHNSVSYEREYSKNMNNQSTDDHSLTTCEYCQTSFPYSLVKLHAQTCNENISNQRSSIVYENFKRCQFCRSIYPDLLLEQHTQTCNRRKNYQCSECHKVFLIRSKLLIHQQSHSDERLHVCKICAKPFKFKSGVSWHMKQQHSDTDSTEFNTTLCEELQGMEYDLLQDDESGRIWDNHDAINVKEQNFEQQHFDKARTDLKTSIQDQENCSYSQKELNFQKRNNNVKENIHCQSEEINIRDKNVREDPNSFDIVEEDLKQNNDMESEENIAEFNFEVNSRSNEISNDCFSNIAPSINMQSCPEDNVYKCQDCPRIFEKPSRLMIHRRAHSKEKLFTCEICRQKFKYKGSLSRHVKEQHYGQGRKSLSMTFDGRQRMGQENFSSTEKFGNGHMYLNNIDESNDGVFRHWKERHYSQGRNSFSMVENCSPLEKINFENNDKYRVNESLGNENLKGEDIGQGRLSKVVDETERNELENCPPLQNMEFKKNNKHLVNQNEDLVYEETNDDDECLYERQNNPSMVFDERQDGTVVNFENVDKYGENSSEVQEHLKQDENNLSMVVNERQGNARSLSSCDEVSFEIVGNTNEKTARDRESSKSGGNEDVKQGEYNLTVVYDETHKNDDNESRVSETINNAENSFEESSSEEQENHLSLVFDQRQKEEKRLSFQDEYSFQNVSNFNKPRMREICKFGENRFEVKESSRQEEDSSESDGRNLDEDSFEFCEDDFKGGENIFEVNSRPAEASDECFTNATQSVNRQRCRKDKVYQCEECEKVFLKRSDWWNHKRKHYSDMSFKCEICGKYFKYKGSLSRHIKEQHYGLGRNGLKMAFEKNQGNNIICSSQARDDLHKEVKTSVPIVKEFVDEEINFDQTMVVDERQGNGKSLSSLGEVSFENVDKTNETNTRNRERCKSGGNEDVKQNGNKLTVVYDETHKDVLDELSFKNDNNDSRVRATINNAENSFEESSSEEQENHLRLVFDQRQKDDKSLSFQGEYSFQNVSNFTKPRMRETQTCKFGENSFEVQGSSRQEENSSESDGRNLDEDSFEFCKDDFKGGEENIFEVNSRPAEASDECFTNATQSVNTQRCRKDKVYQCEECEKVFLKRSDWWNHKRKHYSDMSFSCEICGKYFKYKGSLSRHVKEQHYGLGRKGQGNDTSCSLQGNDSLHKEIENFGSIGTKVDYEESNSKEKTVDESVTFDEMPRSNNNFSKGDYSLPECVSNAGAILSETDNGDSNFKDRSVDPSMIFDVRRGSKNSHSSLGKVASIVSEVEFKDRNSTEETSEESNFHVKDTSMESKNSDFGIENLRVEITCGICGKYFTRKGSLSRHIKEQHYGLGRKSLRMMFDENRGSITSGGDDNFRNRVDCFGAIVNEVDYKDDSCEDRSVNSNMIQGNESSCSSLARLPSQNRVSNFENEVDDKDIDFKEETFELNQSNFENEHSEKENLNKKKSSFEQVVQEERHFDSGQDNDEQTNDATMVKDGGHFIQEEGHLNKNELCVEQGLQEIDQEERKLNSKHLDDHGDKLDNSPLEITCEICGKYLKNKGSLRQHIKEQHLGLRRKSLGILFNENQRTTNSCSSCVDGEAIFSDNKDSNLKEKHFNPSMIFEERQSGENTCSLHGKDLLNTANSGKIVKEVENFEQSNFEKETSEIEQNRAIPPKDDFGSSGGDFQLCLQEEQKSYTKQDHFDAFDDTFENVHLNVFEENKIQESRIETKRKKKGKVYKCEECSKICSNRSGLKKHERTHSNEMLFTCEICHRPFKYKGSLKRHVKEQHYGLGRKCLRNMLDDSMGYGDGCSSVGKVDNLGSIVIGYKDSNIKEENFAQDNFEVKNRGMDMKQDGNYDDAMTLKKGNISIQESFEHDLHETQQGDRHLNSEEENCVQDDSLERTNNKIQQEQNNFKMKNQNVDIKQNNFDVYRLEVLEKKKVHRCRDCPKVFWNISELREHIYKHTDIKSFSCKLCGKAFKFRSGLVRHNRKEHKKNDLSQNVVRENKGSGIEGNGLEEDHFQQERRNLENDLGNEEYSDFDEVVSANKQTKRMFDRREQGFEAILAEGIKERTFGNIANEELSTQSVRQNVPIKKKSLLYNCNKCDAVFKELCDFLTHQRIHK